MSYKIGGVLSQEFPDPAPTFFIFGQRSRLKDTRKFSWMTAILLKNLDLIKLYVLTILQLIIIRNSSLGSNIKHQAQQQSTKG